MFHSPFYHLTMRKVVASFGALFANIYVVKRDSTGKEVERLKVPLAYGPAERYIVRQQEDPELSKNYAIKLPRMSFEIKQLEYDSNRKLNTIKRNARPVEGAPSNVISQYQGVPYNLTIELSVISKFIDDANQIIEQILPWFTPTYTVTINSIPAMSYKDDVAITLQGLNIQDNYEDDWAVRRDIIWTLAFNVKTMFYGPIRDKSIIRRAVATTSTVDGLNLSDANVLQNTAQAQLTTIEVDPDDALFTEDFGFTETLQDNTSGQRINPITGEPEE
jgi:T4-like virus Myoviridae tail sheath stabiliser